MTSETVSQTLKSILAEFRRQLGDLYGDRLVRVMLYGSQARGDGEQGADIDVLVVLKDLTDAGTEIARTGEITAGLSLANDVVLSCAFVSERRLQSEQSPFLMNVRREGLVI